ncbi:hypothetical protein TNCV_1116181 [Trichonephila clavipes]|nr:hypothetical protein TNCV_1116181 [Trichonephila clavipes]
MGDSSPIEAKSIRVAQASEGEPSLPESQRGEEKQENDKSVEKEKKGRGKDHWVPRGRDARTYLKNFVEDLLIPSLLPYTMDIVLCKSFQILATDRPLHVIRHGSCSGISLFITKYTHVSRDRIVGDTVDVIEEMDGKSCTLDEDDLVTAGEESEIFCLVEDERGGNKFKGGHLTLVMFSSFCVVTDIGEGLIAWAYVWGS